MATKNANLLHEELGFSLKLNDDKESSLAERLLGPYKAANREIYRLQKTIMNYTSKFQEVPKTLTHEFNEATKNLEKMRNQLVDIKKQFPAKSYGGQLSNQLLTRFDSYKTFNQNLNRQPQPVDHLKNQTRLEIAQLGMMALNSISQSIAQAGAVGESRYRALAADSAQKGDWIKASEQFREARSWNLKSNLLEGGVNVVEKAVAGGLSGAIIGGQLFGPVGAKAGAVIGGGLMGGITTATESIRIYQEYQQVTEDLERLKDQIISGVKDVPAIFKELKFSLSHEEILSNPLENKDKIKENLKFSTDYSDHMLKNAEIIQADIAALYSKNGTNSENWLDEDIQKLSDLKVAYEQAIGEYNKYTKLRDAYSAADKVIKTQETIDELKKEEERLNREAASKQLTENRLYEKDETARYEFDKEIKKILSEKSTTDAINKLTGMSLEKQKASINTQAERIANLNKEIETLDTAYQNGTATASDLEKLVELEQARSTATKQLQADKDLYNSRADVLTSLQTARRDEVNNLAAAAGSSQYLAENYGSFSRYFGKTDPSLSLIKETNTILKSILETLNYTDNMSVAKFE